MMNVLKITTTPIKLSMTSQRARLESQLPSSKVNIDEIPGNLQMHSQNIKVNIDTYDARQSLGRRTNKDFLAYQAAKGQSAADEATARYVQVGNQMSQIQNGANIPEIIYMQMISKMQPQADLEAVPLPGPDISWTPEALDINYSPSKLEFQAELKGSQTAYVPGELSFNVEQYPRVEIEYTGDPLYVPPSAAPGYEGEVQ